MNSSGILSIDAIILIIFAYGLYGGWIGSLLCLFFGYRTYRSGRRRAGVLSALGAGMPMLHLLLWSVFGGAFGAAETDDYFSGLLAVTFLVQFGPAIVAGLVFRNAGRQVA